MQAKKLLNDKIFSVFLILCMTFVLFWGKGFTSGVSRGLTLWVTTVVPALLPYAFLSAFLLNKSFPLALASKSHKGFKKVFKVGKGSAFAFFINLISGCPLGLKSVADLKDRGLIDKGESVCACILCSTPSPMYLFAIGSLTFGYRRLGVVLILANLFSALITAFCFAIFIKKDGQTQPITQTQLPTTQYQDAFFESLSSCLQTMLSLGVSLALFSALVDALLYTNVLLPFSVLFSKLFGSKPLANAFSVGLIESTWGVTLLAKASHPLSFALSGVVSGLGGLSNLIQTTVILKSAKIKTAPIYLAKVVQAVLNFLFCLAFSLL